MSILKKYWPMSFQIERGNVGAFVVQLVVFLIACTVVGWLIRLLAHIWIIGWIFGLLGELLELYCVAGIVLDILVFVGVIQ